MISALQGLAGLPKLVASIRSQHEDTQASMSAQLLAKFYEAYSSGVGHQEAMDQLRLHLSKTKQLFKQIKRQHDAAEAIDSIMDVIDTELAKHEASIGRIGKTLWGKEMLGVITQEMEFCAE